MLPPRRSPKSFEIILKDNSLDEKFLEYCISDYDISPNEKYLAIIVKCKKMDFSCYYFVFLIDLVTDQIKKKSKLISANYCSNDSSKFFEKKYQINIFFQFTQDSQFFISHQGNAVYILNTENLNERILNGFEQIYTINCYNQIFLQKKEKIIIYSVKINLVEEVISQNISIKTLFSVTPQILTIIKSDHDDYVQVLIYSVFHKTIKQYLKFQKFNFLLWQQNFPEIFISNKFLILQNLYFIDVRELRQGKRIRIFYLKDNVMFTQSVTQIEHTAYLYSVNQIQTSVVEREFLQINLLSSKNKKIDMFDLKQQSIWDSFKFASSILVVKKIQVDKLKYFKFK